MSEDGRRRMNTDPALKGVPKELRPFARKIENPVKRPGDDPMLDDAVTRLRALHGTAETKTKDPLFYEVEAKRIEQEQERERERERGIGNLRVYVAPTPLPGAEAAAAEAAAKEKQRRQVRAAVGAAVVGIGVAGAMAMMGRCGGGESAEWAREGVSARVVETAAGVTRRGVEKSAGAEKGAGTAASENAGAGTAAAESTDASAGVTGRGAMSSATAPAMRRPPVQRKAVRAPEEIRENTPEPVRTAEPAPGAPPAAAPAATTPATPPVEHRTRMFGVES
ncbi:hypothetical protein ACMHYB_53590 [Sorangium sp. So ce1128]